MSPRLRLLPLALAAALAGASACDRAYDARVDALAERIEAEPRNRAFRDALAAKAGDGPEAAREIGARFDALGIVPLRVPGLYYESYPDSGADLDDVERWLDRPVPRAPVDEVGTVEANAAVVARSIRELAVDGRRVAIVSASKGSADVREALETDPESAKRVAIWVDLVGVLEGTPLTNAGSPARTRSAEWLPAETADSMSAAVRAPILATRRFPEGVIAVHVAAFPHADDVGKRVRDAFSFLRLSGPTDGYVLLDSYLRAPGRVLVVRGADHFLLSAGLPTRIAAAIRVALDELEARGSPPGTEPAGR